MLALLGADAYVLVSALHGTVGFALDDAWIHQVYARNLGLNGEFAFFAGQPSAGSTSPLWTILLATGYLFHLNPFAFAFSLGALLLGASAVVASRLGERWLREWPLVQFPLFPVLLPLYLILEWHMAWSAVSGMEIPLFVLLSLAVFERFYARAPAWQTGLLCGLVTLTRPEGIVLAALVGLGIAVEPVEGKASRSAITAAVVSAAKPAVRFGSGIALIVIPYLAFNLFTSGTLLPNTFYAKNAEYAVLFQSQAFPARWLRLFLVPWVGAQVLLVPGALFAAAALVRLRKWRALVPLVWVLLLPALYALRLPVDYQHGRYEMPVVPYIALYGVWGTAWLLSRVRSWTVRATWVGSTAALLIAFWLLGANAYSTDVSIIDCEMVQTAKWTAANAAPGTVVAAHDIGALGYYYPHPFIDLAGLVSPQVIPFIRDQSRLRDYMISRGTGLAIFFPDWYPDLASDPRFVPVHTSGCEATRQAGGTNMVVYQISR